MNGASTRQSPRASASLFRWFAMSSVTRDSIATSRGVVARWLLLALCSFPWGTGCRRSADVTRLDPEQHPGRYRIVCDGSFRPCEAEAGRICEHEYVELSRQSNREELPEVQGAMASSTGPSHGLVDFRGELVIQCGRLQQPIRLVRTPAPRPEATAAPAPMPAEPPPPAGSAASAVPSERVCVPGVTQACLGPGACSGAQSCLDTGLGFGSCDCGAVPAQPAPPQVVTPHQLEGLGSAGSSPAAPSNPPESQPNAPEAPPASSASSAVSDK